VVVEWLGISDTIWALIVTYPTFLVPFSTWLLMGYFRTIPKEVEECALVDGATRMQTLTRIVLPMAIPGIVCVTLFGFTLTWNEFTYALTFVSQTANKTAVVGVTADLIRGDIFYWGSLMAGAVVASLPIVIVYVVPGLLRVRPHCRRRQGLTRSRAICIAGRSFPPLLAVERA
jgi:multiple sugar transport system permease protein